jgi:aryl-alcohol dehydrogenase-like predicted oxidoreductase
MRYRELGRGANAVRVSAIGLGEMPLSIEGRPDEAQAIRTIHAALDAGMTLIDTADAYSLGGSDTGHGERLVAKALATYGGDASEVLVATKGGHLRPGDGSWTRDGRPEYLKGACEASLKALGVEAIGLYQYHRPDPNVAYADSIGAIKELLDEGKILLAGISNANVEQIKLADEILGGRLASVQNQFAPNFRSSEEELEFTRERGIAFLPWSPLGGIGRADEIERKFPAFAELAQARGISPQQLTLAWMLAKGDNVIPIPGSSRPETAQASAAAADIELTSDEVARLDAS